MFNVYDEVWIMRNNNPTKKLVFAVIESMNFSKNGTEKHYRLVDSQIGTGWGNNEGDMLSADSVFPDKESVIQSL